MAGRRVDRLEEGVDRTVALAVAGELLVATGDDDARARGTGGTDAGVPSG